MRSLQLPTAVGVLLLLALAPGARAADNDFSLSFAPYVWLTGVTGTIGVKGFKVDVDKTFGNLYDETDNLAGIFGRAEAHIGKFGLYVDGGYMQLGIDNQTGPKGVASVDFTQNIGLIDFGLMWRLLQLPIGPSEKDINFTLDATGGARYWTMGATVTPSRLPAQSGGIAWFDPTVGLRGTLDLGKHLQVIVGGDIGGFGAASQFTWSAVGTVGYVFNLGSVETSIFAGYKAIGDDYANGGFTWDTVLHGPIIGMSFTF